jgi:hypothetical protein
MRKTMFRPKYFSYLFVFSVLLLLACVVKIMSAETLTLHLPGIEIKAEGFSPSQPSTKN